MYIMDAFVVDSSTQSLIFAVKSEPLAIILQLVTNGCRKLHRMDWSIMAEITRMLAANTRRQFFFVITTIEVLAA